MHGYHPNGFKVLNENYVPAPQFLAEQPAPLDGYPNLRQTFGFSSEVDRNRSYSKFKRPTSKFVMSALLANEIINYLSGSDGLVGETWGEDLTGFDVDDFSQGSTWFDDLAMAAEAGAIAGAGVGAIGGPFGAGGGAAIGALTALTNSAIGEYTGFKPITQDNIGAVIDGAGAIADDIVDEIYPDPETRPELYPDYGPMMIPGLTDYGSIPVGGGYGVPGV